MKYSVIVPIYNSRTTLQRCINSVKDPQLRTQMGEYNMKKVNAFREEESLKAVLKLLKKLQ